MRKTEGRRRRPLVVAGFFAVVLMLASLLGVGLCGSARAGQVDKPPAQRKQP